MKRNYNLSHRLIAYILFISLFLQSCGGFSNQVVPQGKEQVDRTLVLQDNSLINPATKGIVTSDGYLASFYEEDGSLKADVSVDEKQPNPNYKGLPVMLEEGMDLNSLTKLDPVNQKSRIELNRSHSGQVRTVTIRQGGLAGGMKKGEKEKEKEKEKEEETDQEENREANIGNNIEKLRAYAQNGNASAQFKLGQIAYQAWLNHPTEAARDEAEKWLGKAAAQDHQGAIALLRRSNQVPFSQEHLEPRFLDSFHDMEIKKEPDDYLPVVKASAMSTWAYTYKEAITVLENNDPKVKVINLRYERLTQEQLEALKQAIDKNTVVGYIEWGEIPTDCQPLKQQIEDKLVQNICNYTYHPNDYIHGLLASHVYTDPKADQEVSLSDLAKELGHELPTKLNTNWKVARVNDDIKGSGFYSALYVNENTHQAVLSFQGTWMNVKTMEDRQRTAKDLVITDMQEVLGNAIGKQQILAFKETKAAVEYVKEKGFNLSITGHSLGGYLAELGVAFCHLDFHYKQVKAVVFDSPGTDTKLNTFKSNVKNPSTKFSISKLPITTYLSAPNFVNVCHGHVGEVYRLYPNLKGPDWLDKWSKKASTLPIVGKKIDTTYQGLLSITGHSLVTIISLFDAHTGKPIEYARVGDWPRLNTKALKYVGKEGSAGTLLGGAIGGGIGRLVGSNVLGNLGTLGSIATVIADCNNVDQTQFWTTHSYLEDYREVSLESTEGYKQKYKGHYRVSSVSPDTYPLYMDEKENIDGYLYALWGDKEAVENLNTQDITGAVLKNILQEYAIKMLDDKPCLFLKQTTIQIQGLRDKMQRAKEVLTPDRIKETLENSKNKAVCKYVEQEIRKQFQEEQLKKLHKLHSYLPVAKLADYIPRKDKEKKLTQTLEEKGICVVCGHGGVGKSTLVAEYGHKLKDQQIVCWTEAETPDKLIASYEYAAREIGVSQERLMDLKKVAGSNYLAVLAREVYNKLIDHQQPVLLILDNAVKPTLINDCLLHKPDCVKVIVTTRDQRNFADYSLIPLDAFTLEESKEYVEQSLQKLQPSEEDIASLIGEVGLIPQKLALATGYINQISFMDIKKYLTKLEALKKEGKKRKGNLVLPEVNLGLETLDMPSQLVMRYGAYLDPDFIPLSLIKMLLGVNDEEELDILLDPLEKLSLVTIINDSRQIGIQIHREIQTACKAYQDWRKDEEASINLGEQDLLVSIIQVLEKYMPDVTKVPDSKWEQARLYAINIASILAYAEEKEMASLKLSNLNRCMGSYNRHVCYNYNESLRYYKQSIKILQSLYKIKHPRIPRLLNKIGFVYQDLGNYQKALEYLQQALVMNKHWYNNRNEGCNSQVANSLNNIGKVYQNLGQHQEALKYLQKALEMRQALFESNRQDIATSLNNIGSVYCNLGQNQKALEYLKKALEMRQALFESNHQDIANSLNNIGKVYQNLSQYQESLKYLKQALAMRQALFKGNHQDIANSLNNLGSVYKDLGQLDKALKRHKQALVMLKVLHPDNHPDVATSLYSIGIVYHGLGIGKYQKALKYLEQALVMRRALFKGNHVDIVTSLYSIGTVYEDLCQLEKASTYYEQAREMTKFLKESEILNRQERERLKNMRKEDKLWLESLKDIALLREVRLKNMRKVEIIEDVEFDKVFSNIALEECYSPMSYDRFMLYLLIFGVLSVSIKCCFFRK